MLFNSIDFFIFLPLVLLTYFVLPYRLRCVGLLAANLYFYMYWSVPYAAILLLSLVVDFSLACAIDAQASARARRALIIGSVVFNLGLLCFFKYYAFALQNFAWLGLDLPLVLTQWHPVLPLGISFYTFQSMSYTIDVYRKLIPAQRNPIKYAMCVTFFPQLVAGPIERPGHLLGQFEQLGAPGWEQVIEGGKRVVTGFVKKVVLADNVATWVDQAYANPNAYSGAALLLATYGFAWQIYWDFSGYSDIAIGIARIMGIRFYENFATPYQSTSIQEFWRRWHISLSSWLRDYLYIPLGGSRDGPWHTFRNLVITMLLGGLWHGPSWNFVIWGGIHGLWLAAERRASRFGSASRLLGSWARPVAALVVFHGVCVAWIFFRATTLAGALQVLRGIVLLQPGVFYSGYAFYKCLLIVACGASYFAMQRWTPRAYVLASLASTWGILCVILFGAKSNEFIYFVF